MSCCQQYGLYAAEEGVPRGRTLLPGEVQAYVDQLRESDYWQRNFPNVLRIDVHIRRADWQGGSCGGMQDETSGQIYMAHCHLSELFLLHEVAHVLARARYDARAHDPWFARTYLELVSEHLPESYPALYASFVEAGIDFEHESYAPGGIQL